MNKDVLFDIDITEAMAEVAESGAALVKEIIQPKFLEALVSEVLAGPFEPAEEGNANVQQKFERFAYLYEPEGMTKLRELHFATEQLIRKQAKNFPVLAKWKAIDTVVQKYDHTGFLTAHKDLKRHPYLIAKRNFCFKLQF